MITYKVYLVRYNGAGDQWEVWIGAAPEDVVDDYIAGLVRCLNKDVKQGDDPWEAHSWEEIDLATAISGGQIKVADFFYRQESVNINMVQASQEEADSFAQEDDIDPRLDDYDYLQDWEFIDELLDEDTWLDDEAS